MIISWIYWAINLMMILLIIRCVYTNESIRGQITGALVIIPLVLRFLLIK